MVTPVSHFTNVLLQLSELTFLEMLILVCDCDLGTRSRCISHQGNQTP